MGLTEDVKARALALGFALAGVAPAERLADHEQHLRDRLAAGGLAGLEYFTPSRAGLAADPGALLPGARAVVVLATPSPSRAVTGAPSGPRGLIARYARGRDYHASVRAGLKQLVAYIHERAPGAHCRAFVDATPLLERAFAVQAGLGYFGRNNCLIAPGWGSWVTLAEIVTDVPLTPDAPEAGDCGDCRACIAACPTGALDAPFSHRAQLCLSYLTTELRGFVPHGLRGSLGARVLGCDACQDACPRNATAAVSLPAGEGLSAAVALLDLFALDERAFAARFAGTAAARPRRAGFLRNAAVALGNLGDPAAVPVLVAALDDAEPLVRGHAVWALGQLGGARARAALAAQRGREGQAEVRREVERALADGN